MADVISYHSASALIYTGPGELIGFVVSCSSATGTQFEFFDNDEAAVPWLFSAWVSANNPLVIFFPDRFSPMFTTGLYVAVGANMVATVWSRKI